MSKFVQNLQKFKLITFDVTDTLLKFKRHPGIEYASTATSMGFGNINADKLIAQFPNNFRQMNKDYPNFGRYQISWETWWETLISNIFKTAGSDLSESDLQQLTNVLLDKYETSECWELQSGAVELIEKIKGADKIVGVISNFDPRLKFLVKNMNLPKFDFVISSYEVGAAKPDYRIFDLASKLANSAAMSEESLHIGNTPNLDYIAAREADWSSVLITNGKKDWLIYKENINERHVFQSLDDFLVKLESEDIKWDE